MRQSRRDASEPHQRLVHEHISRWRRCVGSGRGRCQSTPMHTLATTSRIELEVWPICPTGRLKDEQEALPHTRCRCIPDECRVRDDAEQHAASQVPPLALPRANTPRELRHVMLLQRLLISFVQSYKIVACCLFRGARIVPAGMQSSPRLHRCASGQPTVCAMATVSTLDLRTDLGTNSEARELLIPRRSNTNAKPTTGD